MRAGTATLAALTALAADAHARPDDLTGTPFATAVHREAASRLAKPPRAFAEGPEVILLPRYVWVFDRASTLPAPPWGTPRSYDAAFEIAQRAWYATQPDRARALIVLSTFDEGGSALFYLPLANDVSGLGVGEAAAVFDDTPGLALEGYIWLGDLTLLERAGDAYFREAFIHEIAHRWASYVEIAHPALPRDALRGRQSSHWSWFADTDASPMEGNEWLPNEDGTFTTALDEPRFSALDLYLMGVLPAEQVAPFHVFELASIVSPPGFVARPDTPPARRSGTAVTIAPTFVHTVTIDDVVLGSGPRSPAPREEKLVWPVGVVLLSRGIEPVALEVRARLDRRLAQLAQDFESATGGRVALDLQVEGAGKLGIGARCTSDDDCDRTAADDCVRPSPSQARVCTRRCASEMECGPGRCCAPPATGGEKMCWAWSQCPGGGRIDTGDAGIALPDPEPTPDPPPLITAQPTGCGCKTACRDTSARTALLLLSTAMVFRTRRSRGAGGRSPPPTARA